MLRNIYVEKTVDFIHSVFKEVMFKLPEDNGRVPGESKVDITQEALRFAIHPGKDRPMIAMATSNYGDLKIMVSVKVLFFIFVSTYICFTRWNAFIRNLLREV